MLPHGAQRATHVSWLVEHGWPASLYDDPENRGELEAVGKTGVVAIFSSSFLINYAW